MLQGASISGARQGASAAHPRLASCHFALPRSSSRRPSRCQLSTLILSISNTLFVLNTSRLAAPLRLLWLWAAPLVRGAPRADSWTCRLVASCPVKLRPVSR